MHGHSVLLSVSVTLLDLFNAGLSLKGFVAGTKIARVKKKMERNTVLSTRMILH